MGYIHFTIKEREMFMCLKANGLTIRAIALHMKRSPSTISRELKCCSGEYSANTAENDYHGKRRNYHKPLLLDSHP